MCLCPGFALDRRSQTSPDDPDDTYKQPNKKNQYPLPNAQCEFSGLVVLEVDQSAGGVQSLLQLPVLLLQG